MSDRRYLLLPIAALVIVGLSYAWAGRGDAVQPAERSQPSASDTSVGDPRTDIGPTTDIDIRPADTGDLDSRIAFWKERIRADIGTATAYQVLGDLYGQRGRATGDGADHQASYEAYREAVERAPGDPASQAGLARILATLHRFPEAIDAAVAALRIDPSATGAVAVVFDASLETGDLDGAETALDVLRERNDGAAVRVREARLAFLRGRTDDAIDLAESAVKEALEQEEGGEPLSFYHYALGEYRFSAGDIDGAGRAYASAAAAMPGSFLALAGEGRVAFARGDVATAIARYESAVSIVPRPESLAYLGDLYTLAGRSSEAADRYETVEFIADLGADGSRPYEREYALYLASHDVDPERAVEITTAQLEERTDVYGYDAHAWALQAAGRIDEALEAARSATALGTQDARLLYHLGMIELDAGLTADGRAHLEAALALNPAFDPLGSRDAREALGR